jgi:hypothetical protein
MSREDWFDEDEDWCEPEPREHFWQSRDGRKYLPREMETTHLENILNMVMRNAQLKLLCRYVTQGRSRDLMLASSPERMRTQLLLLSPILRIIEAEVIRRRKL